MLSGMWPVHRGFMAMSGRSFRPAQIPGGDPCLRPVLPQGWDRTTLRPGSVGEPLRTPRSVAGCSKSRFCDLGSRCHRGSESSRPDRPPLFPPATLRKGIFFANLFPRALSRQGLFHPAFFTWLQVIRVAFHLSNDVFRKHLAFESAKRILYGFALLQSNFCHAVPSHQIFAIPVSYKRRFVPSVCLSRRQSPPNAESTIYSPA
jgi:hypothetical protein